MGETKTSSTLKWVIPLLSLAFITILLLIVFRSPQPEPGYFTPSEDSPLRLEFSYPPEWGLLEEKDAHVLTTSESIDLQGGLIVIPEDNKPSPKCGRESEEEGLVWQVTPCVIPIDDFSGPASILIRVLNIGGKANWGVDFVALMYFPKWNENKPYTVLIDQSVLLDGYPARRIAFVYEPSKESDDHPCRGCNRGISDEIFLDVAGKQYLIAFFSPNPADYDSEFYEQFNALVETIKVVP